MNLYSRNTGISITFLLPKKRATKTGNIAAKRFEKRKCAFLPPTNQTFLETNQVVVSCVKTDFNWNYAGSSQVRTLEWRHLLQNKFALGRQNEQNVQILLQQLELLSTFCNNFSQPPTTWFVCAKTRNIAFQHVLPQCCRKQHEIFRRPFYRAFSVSHAFLFVIPFI